MTSRTLEFYSGIGGLHLALRRSNVSAKVVQAFDWDQTACAVYSANYGQGIATKTDIGTLTAADLARHRASLWLLSPACQPYTVLNPNAQGAKDPRAQSFLHLVQNVLPELAKEGAHPDRMLVENVAGFEDSTTRQILLASLRSLGYVTLELLLTPLQFGIPNSRLRYYLLAKKSPLQFAHVPPWTAGEEDRGHVWRRIPGGGPAWTDPRFAAAEAESNSDAEDAEYSIDELRPYLDNLHALDDHALDNAHYTRHRIPDRVLQRWGRLFDIVKPSSRRTCCFTRGYTQLVERAGSVLQENEELDTTTTFDSFLRAQELGDPDAVRLLDPLKLRYFSPGELLRIFAFDPLNHGVHPAGTETSQDGFQLSWPATVSMKSKYKLIGNSVNVRVVQALIEYLFLEEGFTEI